MSWRVWCSCACVSVSSCAFVCVRVCFIGVCLHKWSKMNLVRRCSRSSTPWLPKCFHFPALRTIPKHLGKFSEFVSLACKTSVFIFSIRWGARYIMALSSSRGWSFLELPKCVHDGMQEFIEQIPDEWKCDNKGTMHLEWVVSCLDNIVLNNPPRTRQFNRRTHADTYA